MLSADPDARPWPTEVARRARGLARDLGSFECYVCYGDFEAGPGQGVVCSHLNDPHFVCSACFNSGSLSTFIERLDDPNAALTARRQAFV